MACISICPKNCITLVKNPEYTNAVIDEDICIKCGLCNKVCQQMNDIKYLHIPETVVEGFAFDKNIHNNSSSGGFATLFAKKIIEDGGYVVGSIYENRTFKHVITNNLLMLEKMQGSKYTKSAMDGVFGEVEKIIKKNIVLFIGTPCQVYGIKEYLNFKHKVSFKLLPKRLSNAERRKMICLKNL